MGSANGTFLNGQRLTPYLPHPLQQGDEVQLGKLQLSVEFDQ
ncbi:MAG: FHA domain-containing protein [Gammaproteobacteria bacterium]